MLLAVPNVSEGRDPDAVAAIGAAFASGGVALLDSHSDPDHHRSVFTLAGKPGALAGGLLAGARAAVARIDLRQGAEEGRCDAPGDAAESAGPRAEHGRADDAHSAATRAYAHARVAAPKGMHRPPGGARGHVAGWRRGAHPYVGALDVLPLVYLDVADRGRACAEALVVADRIGEELGVPVFLYGALAGGRTRAELRRGGVEGLRTRLAGGECRPDFGPRSLHPSAGATLVAAREPLVAFNLQLAPPATLRDARRIAALVREGGAEGLPGVRALGIALVSRGDGVAQVSMNIEDPLEVPLAAVVTAVSKHARLASAELVGLAPRAALAGLPDDLPLAGFDPARHVIEDAIARTLGGASSD